MNKILNEIIRIAQIDRKTLVQKGNKLAAEAGELNEAILLYEDAHGCEYRGVSKEEAAEKVLEEIVDVTLVVISLLPLVGKNLGHFCEMLCKKMGKWETKLIAGDNLRKQKA